MALVSGRAIADIDLIFAPLRLAAIGVHGAEMRISGDADVQTRTAPLSQAFKRKLAAIAEFAPGILVEDKGYSLALHYRLTPEKGPELCKRSPKSVRRHRTNRSKFSKASWSWT